MIAQLVLGLLADAVFSWTSSTARSFQTEVGQYMERRGLLPKEELKKQPAR